jgi:hypothetical protein
MPASPPRVHLVIPTHTTRHLAACVACVARQTLLPETVTVTCDTDDPAIGQLLCDLWPRVVRAMKGPAPALLYVRRPHQGEGRVSQARNNALRALDAAGWLDDRDLVVFIDGDMLLAESALDQHARAGAEVVIPFRVNLDQPRTAAITPEKLLDRDVQSPFAGLARADEMASLARRHRRYRRQLLVRRLAAMTGLPLIKPHKPKLLGGHHSVSVRYLRAVNGFDEQYLGYAWEDDDLSRRLHALRPRVAIAVRTIMAFHLWHPTQASGDPLKDRGYQRFSTRGLPIVAERGWRNPLPQDPPVHTVISAA